MLRTITGIEDGTKFKTIDALYREFDELKKLALYVDIKENGELSTPNLFSKVVCEKVLEFVSRRYLLAERTLKTSASDDDSSR
jgi:hypothetical protein